MGSWATPRLGTYRKTGRLYGVTEPSAAPIDSHLNIGAGRIVWQDIVRIDVSIKKRQFHKNEAILESFKHAKEGNGRLHLLGLVCSVSPSLKSPY